MAPFFSIVVPTFNSAKTLHETLSSIAKQGRNDVEVVLIDGGSKDATLEVAREFSAIISSTVCEPDKGIYDAINKGVARARGEYVNVLGSDDTFCQYALDLIAQLIGSGSPDLVAGGAWMIKAGQTDEKRRDEVYGPGALVSGIPFCHNALFVRRSAYEGVGPYSLDYKICADSQWVHRAIKRGMSCVQSPQPVVRFALNGLSSNASVRVMDETYRTICENFPGLSMEEAEQIFKAVRGWTAGDTLEAILKRHSGNFELLESLTLAFRNRANSLATELGELKSAPSGRPHPAATALASSKVMNRARRIARRLMPR